MHFKHESHLPHSHVYITEVCRESKWNTTQKRSGRGAFLAMVMGMGPRDLGCNGHCVPDSFCDDEQVTEYFQASVSSSTNVGPGVHDLKSMPVQNSKIFKTTSSISKKAS